MAVQLRRARRYREGQQKNPGGGTRHPGKGNIFASIFFRSVHLTSITVLTTYNNTINGKIVHVVVA